MKVIRKALPLNSNLAIAQAAATPKAALSGTATAATTSVSLIADSTSGLAKDATASPTPLASAWVKTATSGAKSTRTSIASTPAIMAIRSQSGSVVAAREWRRSSAMPA